MKRIFAICATLIAMPVMGQDSVVNAGGAVLRVLDKTAGEVQDVTLRDGQVADMGLLQVQLDECRYPQENPAGDAFAHMQIFYGEDRAQVFDGWMIAAAPALNAMDHPRFDVWVLRCTT